MPDLDLKREDPSSDFPRIGKKNRGPRMAPMPSRIVADIAVRVGTSEAVAWLSGALAGLALSVIFPSWAQGRKQKNPDRTVPIWVHCWWLVVGYLKTPLQAESNRPRINTVIATASVKRIMRAPKSDALQAKRAPFSGPDHVPRTRSTRLYRTLDNRRSLDPRAAPDMGARPIPSAPCAPHHR